MPDERFMRHHYGASGYVPPIEQQVAELRSAGWVSENVHDLEVAEGKAVLGATWRMGSNEESNTYGDPNLHNWRDDRENEAIARTYRNLPSPR